MIVQPQVRRPAWIGWSWLLAGLGLGVICSLPVLHVGIHNIALNAVVTESLGYRYFDSLRVLRHENGLVFVVQGHVLGVVQHLINLVLQNVLASPITNLRENMHAFTYATIAFNALALDAVLIVAVVSRRLLWTDKLLVGAVALSGVYGSHSALSAAISPDYYALEVVFTVLALYVFLLQRREPLARYGSRQLALLGALAGLMAGTKISLVWSGYVAATPGLLESGLSGAERARRAVLVSGLCGLTFASSIATFYLLDLSRLPEFFARWVGFVASPGAEPDFWTTLLHPERVVGDVGADYGYAPVLLGVWSIAVLGVAAVELRCRGVRSPAAAVLIAILATGGLHIFGLMTRPAGTTLFEIGLFAAMSAAAAIGLLTLETVRQVAAVTFSVVVVSQAAVSGVTGFTVLLPVAPLQQSSTTAWGVHAWLVAQQRPVIVYLPDNRYAGGTVEEALMKGMSDLPSWNITTGQQLLDIVAPGFSFRQSLETVPAGTAVMWLDIQNETPLTDQTEALRMMLQQPGVVCRNWVFDTYPWWRHVAHTCAPAA
jgi:hypothetical protein